MCVLIRQLNSTLERSISSVVLGDFQRLFGSRANGTQTSWR
jgi:hypothetical protein